MKKIVRLFLSIFIFVIIAIVLGAGFLIYLNMPPDDFVEDQMVTVPKGAALSSIAKKLEFERIIRMDLPFLVLSRIMGTQNQLKYGYYRIPAASSMYEVHNILLSGKQELRKLTIPEGWTLKGVARFLDNEGICSYSSFIQAASDPGILEKYSIPGKNLEGYLFPDTYFIPMKIEAEALVEILVDTFFDRFAALDPDISEKTPGDIYDIVRLASIVEREYKIPEEAPLMASVFYNRLHNTVMHLGSCATVVYIITDIQDKEHPEFLLDSDIEIKSPYNTYINYGLPPGPISNPGITALSAAIDPPETDYLYFLLRNGETGEHYFSKTNEEHMQAKYRYIKPQ